MNTPAGAEFDILQNRRGLTNMPDHGGRPDLAPFPDWTARYLVHRNLTQRAFVLANGDLSGSWPIHMREAGALSGVGPERLVSIDQRPNLWLDERAQTGRWDYVKGTPLPIRDTGRSSRARARSALIPDNAHQPSLAYVPYLMTGDRYYAEEMAFWANYSMARTFPGDGLRNSQGIIENNEVRGIGWPLRNMVDAAAYYPDSSPVKAYLSQKVINNLQWLDSYATSQINPVTNPFSVSVDQQTPGRWAVHLALGAIVPGLRDRSRESAGVRRRPDQSRRDRPVPSEAVHERARLPEGAGRRVSDRGRPGQRDQSRSARLLLPEHGGDLDGDARTGAAVRRLLRS